MSQISSRWTYINQDSNPCLSRRKDLIKKKVTKKIAENIEHATLVIVPGEGHGSYIEHSDKLYPLLYSFLNK